MDELWNNTEAMLTFDPTLSDHAAAELVSNMFFCPHVESIVFDLEILLELVREVRRLHPVAPNRQLD